MPPLALHHRRRDLHDLKSQITRKLGPERAQRYFTYLNRLLTQKLRKSEFDKLCLLTLGRENVHLHNQFIRLILQNACQAKVPPPVIHDKHSFKPGKIVGKKSSPADDWLSSQTVASTTSVLSNGEILSPSPCRSRSTNHKIKDHSSSLGHNGKTEAVAHQLQVHSGEGIIGGRCDSITSSLKTLGQHQQGGNEELTAKKQRVGWPLPHDQAPVHCKVPLRVVTVEDGEELTQTESAQPNRDPICAPLGVPFCPVNIGRAQRPPPLPTCTNNHVFASYGCSGELCHTEALRKRMEKIARAQDVGGVTMECANLLNNGLDVYLKRLIKSCVELVGARAGYGPINQPLVKQQSRGKVINGTWRGNHVHVQSFIGSSEGTQELRNHRQVSLVDFRVAMEQSPEQLGGDWPLLLEKVCIHSFEE